MPFIDAHYPCRLSGMKRQIAAYQAALRRLVTMTPEERRKVATKAAKTRWAKHAKKHS